jgi:hypothetical protein
VAVALPRYGASPKAKTTPLCATSQ